METQNTVELLKQFDKQELKNYFEEIEEVSEENDPGSPVQSNSNTDRMFLVSATQIDRTQVPLSSKNKETFDINLTSHNEAILGETKPLRSAINNNGFQANKKRNKKVRRTLPAQASLIDKGSFDAKNFPVKSNKQLKRFTVSSSSRATVFAVENPALRKTSLQNQLEDELFQVPQQRKTLEIEVSENDARGFRVSDKRISRTEQFFKDTNSIERQKSEVGKWKDNPIFKAVLKNQKKSDKRDSDDLSYITPNFPRINFKSFTFSGKSAKSVLPVNSSFRKKVEEHSLKSRESLPNERDNFPIIYDYHSNR